MSPLMSTHAAGVIPEFSLGDRLRKARELTGLQQSEFAEEIGVSRGTVSNYEADRGGKPKLPYLMAWSMRTGVPLEWLQHGTVPSGPQDGEAAEGTQEGTPPRGRRRGSGKGSLPRLDSNQQPFGYVQPAVARYDHAA